MKTPRETLQRNLDYLNGQIAQQDARIEKCEEELAKLRNSRAEIAENAELFTAAINHLDTATKEDR